MKWWLLPIIMCYQKGPRPNVTAPIKQDETTTTTVGLSEEDLVTTLFNIAHYQDPPDKVRVLSNIIQIELDEANHEANDHEYSITSPKESACHGVVMFPRSIFYLTILSVLFSFFSFLTTIVFFMQRPKESFYIRASPVDSNESSSLTYSQ